MAMAFVGDEPLTSRISAIAAAADCAYVGGESGGALAQAWRRCLGRPV
jgi:hypothetical protein